MILLLHFSGWSLLVVICILSPLIYYFIKATDEPVAREPIASVDNPMGLDDLAPVDEAEHSQAYLDALRWALGNPKVHNIAMTGPYGSGKSSILRTFKKQYESEFNCLNISLASFTDQPVDISVLPIPASPKPESEKSTNSEMKTSEQRKNEAQQLIELSVLQQIFYKVDQADIPRSRFKRIGRLSNSDTVFFCTGCSGCVYGIGGVVVSETNEPIEFYW